MPIKKRIKNIDPEAADKLADKLADKPYGDKPIVSDTDMTRTTISLPTSLLRSLEDIALSNKRSGKSPKNVSALVREALEQYMK